MIIIHEVYHCISDVVCFKLKLDRNRSKKEIFYRGSIAIKKKERSDEKCCLHFAAPGLRPYPLILFLCIFNTRDALF